MAITTAAAAILGGSNLLSGGIQAWATWYGINKQAQENEKAYQRNLGMFEKQQAVERAENAKAWKWKEEERDYQRKISSLSQTFQALSSNPSAQAQTINLWRS
jgi:hypothetical protein